jgi:hypothetical protein
MGVAMLQHLLPEGYSVLQVPNNQSVRSEAMVKTTQAAFCLEVDHTAQFETIASQTGYAR